MVINLFTESKFNDFLLSVKSIYFCCLPYLLLLLPLLLLPLLLLPLLLLPLLLPLLLRILPLCCHSFHVVVVVIVYLGHNNLFFVRRSCLFVLTTVIRHIVRFRIIVIVGRGTVVPLRTTTATRQTGTTMPLPEIKRARTIPKATPRCGGGRRQWTAVGCPIINDETTGRTHHLTTTTEGTKGIVVVVLVQCTGRAATPTVAPFGLCGA